MVMFFYVDSRACIGVGNYVSRWFLVNVGLRQCCMMSPWLFSVYMYGVVREVNHARERAEIAECK